MKWQTEGVDETTEGNAKIKWGESIYIINQKLIKDMEEQQTKINEILQKF
jgi:hypothetical protein